MGNNQIPITSMRRKDRQVSDRVWIEDFLSQAAYGAIATSIDSQPFINHNLFVFDRESDSIYFHTADQGQLLKNIQENPKVCFSCASMGRLLPAKRAREFSVEFASIVAYGTASVVTIDEERKHALELLMEKYTPQKVPGVDYPVIDTQEMKGTAVYRIKIKSWSGKMKNAPENFPEAYSFNPEQNPVQKRKKEEK